LLVSVIAMAVGTSTRRRIVVGWPRYAYFE
jgi:hypothetical protein